MMVNVGRFCDDFCFNNPSELLLKCCQGSEIKDNRRYFNVEDCDKISIILVLELKQKSFIQIMGTLYKQTPGHKYRLFRILGRLLSG